MYNAWKAKNPKRVTNTPSIDLKQAIVDQFKNEAKILIATDIASEGLNLQFCDTVINYDLPWNPMKIEQRIGRCHRYGQERDVHVYNLLNTENKADKRVYEILKTKFNLFEGVFGASDEALGLLESGSNFEKRIVSIYEHNRTDVEILKELDKLEREISAKRSSKQRELKQLLSVVNSDEKKKHLSFIANDIEQYALEINQWQDIAKKAKPVSNTIVKIQNAGLVFDSKTKPNGYVFTGALTGHDNKFLMPVLMLFDENGNIMNYDAGTIIDTFKIKPDN
jgi:superfamily II DNA/RNA helicase